MNNPAIFQVLCVRATLVILMSGSVTAFHLWSRLRDAFNMDTALYNRDIRSHHTDLTDPEHGVRMGVPNTACDDGVHGISIDWDPDDTSVLVCTERELRHLKQYSEPLNIIEKLSPIYILQLAQAVVSLLFIGLHVYHRTANQSSMDICSLAVEAQHMCLDKEIRYSNSLPLNGNHRPLWPQFGEYEYLPPQRWVHSLEHGAVVLLYHPCKFGSDDLTYLKNLLKVCLSKHIIAPYKYIPHHMPFALLAFRHARLLSNAKDLAQVTQFIRSYALLAPETHVLKDGQYRAGLIQDVPEVTNAITCPKL